MQRTRIRRRRVPNVNSLVPLICLALIIVSLPLAYAKNDKDKNKNKQDKDKDKNKNKPNKDDNKNKPDKNPQEDWNEEVPLKNGQCTLCADGSEPDLFLSSPELGNTCAGLSEVAATLTPQDPGCSAMQVIGYQNCACPTYPEGYCTLCHGGFFDIPNKDTPVSSDCGYTCNDVLFVEQSSLVHGCDSLMPFRRRCGCPAVAKSCPVCANAAQDYYRDKVYQEYGLTCENLGLARELGYSNSCVELQLKFRYFCGCPGATPECTLCQAGDMPPDPSMRIPILNRTCGDVNDLASLHSKAECAMEMNTMDYNAAGYCGCAFYGPLNQCTFCDRGSYLLNPNMVPTSSPDGSTCGELEKLANYVWTPTDLCTQVQRYAPECCT